MCLSFYTSNVLFNTLLTVGRLNASWMNPQGLYHLTRDCANHLLRHLLRTVDPKITTEMFRVVDDQTMALVAEIFSITPEELTPTVRTRITLPISKAGLSIRTYVDEAAAAYLGCLARVIPALPSELWPHVPHFAEATALLAGKVPEDKIPEFQDLLPNEEDDDLARNRRSRLGQDLKEAIEENTLAVMVQAAPEQQQCSIRDAEGPMAGDFLRASIWDRSCIMQFNFELITKLHLAIPVTPSQCWIGNCNGTEVHQFGAHGYHCNGRIVNRHNTVRDTLLSEFRSCARDSAEHMDVTLEPRLGEFGIAQRHDAVDKRAARADIAISMPGRNWIGFADVTIVHPNLGVNSTADYLKAAEIRKHKRYEPNYHVSPLQILPLAFSTLGVWSKEAIENVQTVLRVAAGNDNDKFNRLFSRLRFRVAIAIAKGEGAILNWLRYKNRMPVQTVGVAAAPETAEEQADEIRQCPAEGFLERYDVVEEPLVNNESAEEEDEAFESAVEEDEASAEVEESEGDSDADDGHSAEVSADEVLGSSSSDEEESSQGADSPSADEDESAVAEEEEPSVVETEQPGRRRSTRVPVLTSIYQQHLQQRGQERKGAAAKRG